MKIKLIAAFCLGGFFLTGCATVDGPADPEDPFESYNRSMDAFNNEVDRYVLKPVAQGYDAVTPKPVQKGVSNFFSNLDDVVVIFNDLLQLKLGQLASDTGRLVINSTVGLFGLIDWASDIGLKKHNEDFGQTLGYWGIPSGPYLILPLLGPSTIRDTGGLIADSSYLDPIDNEIEEKWRYPSRDSSTSTGLTIVKIIDKRAGLLKAEGVVDEAALDRYIYIRDAFLQKRENLVYDGKPPQAGAGAEQDGQTAEDDIFED